MLRTDNVPSQGDEMQAVHKGLVGVVADETSICQIIRSEDRLYYRGFSIEELTANSTFEEVSYILTRGELPDGAALEESLRASVSRQRLPESLKTVLEQIPEGADPIDVLRTSCSFLGSLYPETDTNDIFTIGTGFSNALTSALMYWYHFHRSGLRIETSTQEATSAGHLLHLLHQTESSELHRIAIDVSLVIYAEHDLNASTYAARITASTLSDVYSCLTSAIGALRGPLHGGANARVMTMLEGFRDPEAAEQAILKMLAEKKRVFGFGQRDYSTADPRNFINKKLAERLSRAAGDMNLFNVAERVEAVMWRERKIFANLDYYTALIYRMCELPTNMFPAVFVIARAAGIFAHVAEQRAANKLIHPSSKYIGPAARPYKAVGERAA